MRGSSGEYPGPLGRSGMPRLEGMSGLKGTPETTQPTPFHLAVFDQSDYWLDPEGERFALSDLPGWERRRLARWLLGHADFFYLQALRRALVSTARASPDDDASGIGDQRDSRDAEHVDCEGERVNCPGVAGVAAGSTGVPKMLFVSSRQWMQSTPLLVALGRPGR